MDDKYFLGVTGEIGCGKSYTCKSLVSVGKLKDIAVTYEPCDDIGKSILLTTYPEYLDVRIEIAKRYGWHLINSDTSLDKDKLGDTIINPKTGTPEQNKARLDEYNEFLSPVFKEYIDKSIDRAPSGLILLETALLAELNAFEMVDYNVLLIKVSEEKQIERLMKRKSESLEESLRRKSNQFSFAKKEEVIREAIRDARRGYLRVYDTSLDPGLEEAKSLFVEIMRNIATPQFTFS